MLLFRSMERPVNSTCNMYHNDNKNVCVEQFGQLKKARVKAISEQ